jgi:hypothetical protein
MNQWTYLLRQDNLKGFDMTSMKKVAKDKCKLTYNPRITEIAKVFDRFWDMNTYFQREKDMKYSWHIQYNIKPLLTPGIKCVSFNYDIGWSPVYKNWNPDIPPQYTTIPTKRFRLNLARGYQRRDKTVYIITFDELLKELYKETKILI